MLFCSNFNCDNLIWNFWQCCFQTDSYISVTLIEELERERVQERGGERERDREGEGEGEGGERDREKYIWREREKRRKRMRLSLSSNCQFAQVRNAWIDKRKEASTGCVMISARKAK